MTLPAVYPILDTASLRSSIRSAAAEALLEGGAQILQFRHKAFWAARFSSQAEQIAALCARSGRAVSSSMTAPIMPRCFTPACTSGRKTFSPSDARRVIGPMPSVGFSTHNAAQMQAAQTEPVDYVAFGPVFPTHQGTPRSDRRNRKPAGRARGTHHQTASCYRRHHTRQCIPLLECGRGLGRHHRRSAARPMHQKRTARKNG